MTTKTIQAFNEGDYVVVSGVTTTNDGVSSRNMSIAQVVGVGNEELFLKCSKSHRVYKRPLSNCYKVPSALDPSLPTTTRPPALGDFVMSYSGGRFTKEKKVIGILIEIIDSPPNDVDARILCGEETHVVPISSIIVVEGVNGAS